MPGYKIIKEDGKEYFAKDIQTLKRWIKEKRVKPSEHVYHPTLERWLPIKDMFEIKEISEKTSTQQMSLKSRVMLSGIIVMVLGVIIGIIGFVNEFDKVGIVGIKIVIFGFIIFLLAMKRNKKTLLISGGLVIGLILSSVIPYMWVNRIVNVKKVEGIKCSECNEVISADTSIVSIVYKEKAGQDFIFEYKDTLCSNCKEKISQVADKLYREGKEAYKKGNYDVANTKLFAAKGKYVIVGSKEIEQVNTWLEKTRDRSREKKKKEKEKLEIVTRKAFERIARNKFLDEGWDIRVKVHGPKNKYVTLTWILIGDVFVHQFRKSGICQELHNLGFTRIYFKDGFNYSSYVYWDDK